MFRPGNFASGSLEDYICRVVTKKPMDDLEVEVRPGLASDAAGVCRLFRSYQNWANAWNGVHEVVQFRVTEDEYAHTMRMNPSAVATTDESVIGFAVCEVREINVIELLNIYVDDAYRNSGIGGRLLDELESQCHSLGITTMFGFSSEKYYAGKRLPTTVFEQHGWEVRRLSVDTEMYLRDVPLTEEEAQRAWPAKGITYPQATSDVVTVESLQDRPEPADRLRPASERGVIQLPVRDDQTAL